MVYDLIIKNGHIIDPFRKLDCIGDIYVSGDKIVEPEAVGEENQAAQVLDADGYIVVPGLIDFHAHLFHGATELGVQPDLGLIPNGVTASVDAGSTGYVNYEAFHNNIVTNSQVRIKGFINVSPVGQPTSKYDECIDPKYYDINKLRALLEKYPGEILGLKLRLSRVIAGELGVTPLLETLKLAEELGCPVMVHPTDPPVNMNVIVDLLRKGDILTHMYHGTGSTILDENGKVLESVRDARKRGVIFEDAQGRNNMCFRTARAAISDSFLPDTICTDLTVNSLYKHPVISLPNVISKYINLGVELNTIIKACTSTPARLMNLQGCIGTLKAGAFADIAIFKLSDVKSQFNDTKGDVLEGSRLFVPVAAVKAGKVMYRRIDFR